MTVAELIEILESMKDTYGEDAEVRLMTQQSWPFENAIRGVVSTEDIHLACTDDEDESDDERAEGPATNYVYIVEGGQIGYGNKAAWDAC